jgi:hypothetical protein
MKATIKTNANTSREEIFTFDIPEMIGSEKQSSWAESIFVDVISSLCGMASGKMDNPSVKSQYDMILAKLQTVTDAKFWIENRSNNFKTIYKSL